MKPLTPKQRLTLCELCKGRTNLQMAATFGVSENTIKQQCLRLYAKLGCSNRIQAVTIARERLICHATSYGQYLIDIGNDVNDVPKV